MLKQCIKLAYQKPHLRIELLPIIKLAMEFSSKEQLEEYLKDHPNADPKNHSVKKTESKSKSKILTPKTKKILASEAELAAYKAKVSFNHAQPKDIIGVLTMQHSVKDMVSKVRDMKWDPKNKRIPEEMKKACETINNRSYFGRFLLGTGAAAGVEYGMYKIESVYHPVAETIAKAVEYSPATAAKIVNVAVTTLGFEGSLLAVGGAVFVTAYAAMSLAYNKVLNHFEKKDEEEEKRIKSENHISEVAFDIFMGKYTPGDINNKYKYKTDDIIKKMSEKKINPEQALKEIEKLEKEYKEKVIPGIEKALTSSGWKKDKEDTYTFEDKEFEKKYNSFFKKGKDEGKDNDKDNNKDENMFIQFRYLKNRVKELYVMQKCFENPKLFSKAIIEVIEENS